MKSKRVKVVNRLKTGKAPIAVVISPDGQAAYVSNAEDTHVSRIDLKDFSVKKFADATGANGLATSPLNPSSKPRICRKTANTNGKQGDGQFLKRGTQRQYLGETMTNGKTNDLANDSRIGHYRIISKIGKGGMGEVYLAQDIKLDRKVALKILPVEFAEDKDRMSRFVREAKAASALNHPNILTIYEINEFENTHFIATEFIDGKTLSDYTKANPLNYRSTLEIAIQVASALDEAHLAGIVHRDIKPDNIMVRASGLVKILDFGIAKLTEKRKAAIESEDATTIQSGTTPGMIIGTANYMSPEQAKGQTVDARTDIFSFGVVLYEMIAGNLPFAGETPMETMAAIINKEPKPLKSKAVPPEIEGIISQSLRKDRNERYQTIKDLLSDLKDVKQELEFQDKLEKTLSPNDEEPKTQMLKAATLDGERHTATAENRNDSITIKKSNVNKAFIGVLAILLISVIGFFGYKYLIPTKQIESIAVMPFVNESGNSDAEYLSDGMTETLIKSLSNIPNLSVKARSSVFRYKGQERDFKKIADELKVQAILSGAVKQRGDRLILELELIDAQTENRIWGDTYARPQTDLVSLQNEIARDVSNNLKAKLSGAETVKIADSGTTDSEAFQAYLKGRYFLSKATNESAQQALKYFQDAVALDPKFAPGYAGIADCYTLLGTVVQARMTPEQTMPQAKIAAEKAIELDSNLSEAYVSLAWIKFRYDWDWAGAEKDFQKAIKLNPNNAQARQWYGEFLSVFRRDEQALGELKKARDLEPFNLLMQWNYARTLSDFGRFQEALPEIRKIYEMDKNFTRIYRVLRQTYAGNGMEAEAFDVFIKERELQKDSPERLELYKKIYREKGYEGFEKWQLKTYLLENKNASATVKALYYAALKDKENTLRSLEEAYQQRLAGVLYIRFPQYDFLKDEPRYGELFRKINFPQ